MTQGALPVEEWMKLGAQAAFAGAETTDEALVWLVQRHPEIFNGGTQLSALTPQEDSESSPVTPADRALQWADDIRSRPLNDTQAIELAKVYALLAIHERMPVPRKPKTRTTKDS